MQRTCKQHHTSFYSMKFIPERQYNNTLQRECCLDGMREIPVSYSCQRRSEYIVDGPACVEAFLRCCRAMEHQRAEIKLETLQLARSKSHESTIWFRNTHCLSDKKKNDELFNDFFRWERSWLQTSWENLFSHCFPWKLALEDCETGYVPWRKT